jgi:hypothetical protein
VSGVAGVTTLNNMLLSNLYLHSVLGKITIVNSQIACPSFNLSIQRITTCQWYCLRSLRTVKQQKQTKF